MPNQTIRPLVSTVPPRTPCPSPERRATFTPSGEAKRSEGEPRPQPRPSLHRARGIPAMRFINARRFPVRPEALEGRTHAILNQPRHPTNAKLPSRQRAPIRYREPMRPTPPAISPQRATTLPSQASAEKTHAKKADSLTPWRNGLLPGHENTDILNQHLRNLAHSAVAPHSPAPPTTEPRSSQRPLVRRRSHEIRGRAPTGYTNEPTDEPRGVAYAATRNRRPQEVRHGSLG